MSEGDSADASSDELHWRETYFILFLHQRRPALEEVRSALQGANHRFQLKNLESDDQGGFESLLVESQEDHAAVEISYESGEAVNEQNLSWAQEIREQISTEQLQELIKADARLIVAHFEKVSAGASNEPAIEMGFLEEEFREEDAYDMLDPTCLLIVVEALAGLTGGLTFDPAAGEILE